MWLVRLDGYTACAAKHENEGVVADFLQDLKASAPLSDCLRFGLNRLYMVYASSRLSPPRSRV